MLDIFSFHFHDTVILKVIEETESDSIIMEVEYPVDWDNNRFERRRLVFSDAFNYQVHEQPFAGSPTIIKAEVVGEEKGWSKLRLNTNAGYREVYCKVVELLDS